MGQRNAAETENEPSRKTPAWTIRQAGVPVDAMAPQHEPDAHHQQALVVERGEIGELLAIAVDSAGRDGRNANRNRNPEGKRRKRRSSADGLPATASLPPDGTDALPGKRSGVRAARCDRLLRFVFMACQQASSFGSHRIVTMSRSQGARQGSSQYTRLSSSLNAGSNTFPILKKPGS